MTDKQAIFDLYALWAFCLCQSALVLFQPSWPDWLGIHCVAVLLLWSAGGFFPEGLSRHGAWLSLVTGPFGAAIVALIATARALYKSCPADHAAWYRLLSGVEFDVAERTIAEKLKVGRGIHRSNATMPSLQHIFTRGSRADKQLALRWVAQHRTEFEPGDLRPALDNADGAIRAEAAALVERMNRDR